MLKRIDSYRNRKQILCVDLVEICSLPTFLLHNHLADSYTGYIT